jgi:phosphopantothenoylcysteine decarboxylase/phosphopantothenate--cysteine ligase
VRVLITAGATREPIDGVRYLTNFSSGRTASVVAETLAKGGHEVIYLHGLGAVRPEGEGVITVAFESFGDLNKRLKWMLVEEVFDAIIHMAAVSDYSVSHLECNGERVEVDESHKISSDNELKIALSRNFKILDRLKGYAKEADLKLIGFKLTKGAGESDRQKAVGKLFENRAIDYVVQNDLTEIDPEKGLHRATIYSRERAMAAVSTKVGLAKQLLKLLEGSDDLMS